jgi:hypothetical protein
MRRWILNLHLYASLVCAPYLIIFGISSLNFNHHFAFMKPAEVKSSWEKEFSETLLTNDVAAADAVRDSLKLAGWPLPWEMKREANGNFRFSMENPGRKRVIEVRPAEKKVSVEERAKGFWPVLNSLHGFTQLPNSSLAPIWGIYTDVCVWTVVFAGISGVYLWLTSKRQRGYGAFLLGGGVLASLGFMIYVVLHG